MIDCFFLMLSSKRLRELLWPHECVRHTQDELVISIDEAIKNKRHMVIHAPTGLGKTAASLAPAVSYAIKNDLKVFFLTSRHTQHKIAIDTARLIEKKHSVKVPVANLIGKKWMCLQPGVSKMFSGEFSDYCRRLKEDKKCSFFENLKNGSSLSADTQVALVKANDDPSSQNLRVIGQSNHVCPYEIGMLAARSARVIVTDYYYIFHPAIRDSFLSKIGVSLDKCIIIVDEAHNLPSRIKELASVRISLRVANMAVKEAEQFDYSFDVLPLLSSAISDLSSSKRDFIVSKDDLLSYLGSFDLDSLERAADAARDEQKHSFIGSVHSFLKSWGDDKDGFARILKIDDDKVMLSHQCLDPGVISGPVVSDTFCSIFMSGTLSPTSMYAEILDLPLNCAEHTFRSPFPATNRLTMIVPKTTTKYSSRSDAMYKAQGELLFKMTDAVPGNCVIFFPSYFLLDRVRSFFEPLSSKPVFSEQKGMPKGDREVLLSRFQAYKDSGAVLLGVMSGSFAEGVDMPGDLLKAVFVIGLPLARPDIATQALIDYYDGKFKRGWDYGYVFPAFNKILQSAGRCIRSESDRGVMVFIDERYAWRSYRRCFPPHWDLRVSSRPVSDIRSFFGVSNDRLMKLDEL